MSCVLLCDLCRMTPIIRSEDNWGTYIRVYEGSQVCVDCLASILDLPRPNMYDKLSVPPGLVDREQRRRFAAFPTLWASLPIVS